MAKTPRIIAQPDAYKLSKVSATQISLLSGSRVTIAGIQYQIGSDINLTLSGLTAIGLYMVYAVVSGGSVSLTYSTNVNSVGPSGYTAWRLVGAFYANGSSQFGSFVTIEGVPTTENSISWTPALTTNSGTLSNASTMGTFSRAGDLMLAQVTLSFGANPGTFNEPNLQFPGSLSADGGKMNVSGFPRSRKAVYYQAGVNVFYDAQIWMGSTNKFNFGYAANAFGSASAITQASPHTWASGDWVSGIIEMPITGWNNIPLKDL